MAGLGDTKNYVNDNASGKPTLIAALAFMFSLGLILSGVYVFLNFEQIAKVVTGNLPFQLGATIILVFVGWFLNWVKVTYRFQYALLELVVGALGIFISFNTTPMSKGVGALFGGLYVVVRGVDNLKEYQKKKDNKNRPKTI